MSNFMMVDGSEPEKASPTHLPGQARAGHGPCEGQKKLFDAKLPPGVPKEGLMLNFRILCASGAEIASPAHLPGQSKEVSGPNFQVPSWN